MKNGIFFKLAIGIIAAYYFFAGLFYVQDLLIPILFAAILSMLLLPLCRRLEKKMNRPLAITICLFVVIFVISGLLFLLYNQLMVLSQDFPLIKEKALEKFQSIQVFIESKTQVSAPEQMDWIKNNYAKFLNATSGFIKSFLIGLTGGLATFILILIYIFFFLLLRERFRNFILRLFPKEESPKVSSVIIKTEELTLHYVTGLLIEILALGALNSIGFLALGIRQAIFWGYLGAVLNLIPYIGAIIGAIFPIIIAVIYKDSMFYPIAVLGVVFITQFIDNNFLTPKIVGAHIRINPLATIIIILIGGALWGLPGMILFLPLLGMFKIVCDNIDSLQPLGYLLGEDPEPSSGPSFFRRLINRFKKK